MTTATATSPAPAKAVPPTVYVLAAGVFAMVTSEFAVAGLMPQLAAGLDTGIARIGYLVTVFAAAMAVGGPLLAFALLGVAPRTALVIVFAVFLVGNVMAALATGYPMMVVARIISGTASQAFFGLAVSMGVRLVGEQVRGRAVAVVMNGLMLGTLLGLPLATFVGGRFGWRAAFWAISAITLLAAVLTLAVVRNPASPADGGVRPAASAGAELAVLRSPQLLWALASSTLIIGAAFSAFSFLTPILTEVSGFSGGSVPVLLLLYGAATLVGNLAVGRLADRHTVSTLLVGTGLSVVFLAGFALFTDVPPLALACVLGIGLVGVPMNPAMAVRVQRAGSTAPLVNTVHGSFITLGVIISSAVGSALIPRYGLRAPVVLGVGLAVLAVLAILPALASPYLRRGTPQDAPAAAKPPHALRGASPADSGR
ncbi:Predicted arabinose efflux permease, MFS family [Streptomyces zhaozhouensis]|uniref:Predicted arabinose efflux permease, MFS family n=1 Tax=Streptomyces zhaozhouensis TaxID=1300267 RepID=A0A286DXG7_9ACTN|nr:MFS transporter [Streptomyces zhaozhouensis]SOD63358.1 Predicted arabinose efflux permease, MFS family [Streptomyces zhaozhouensis]